MNCECGWTVKTLQLYEDGGRSVEYSCGKCKKVFDFSNPDTRLKIIREVKAIMPNKKVGCKSVSTSVGLKYYEKALNYPYWVIKDALETLADEDYMKHLENYENRSIYKQYRTKEAEKPYYLNEWEVVEMGTSFARSFITKQ